MEHDITDSENKLSDRISELASRMEQELHSLMIDAEVLESKLRVCDEDEPTDPPPKDGVVLELPKDLSIITRQVDKNNIIHEPYNKSIGNNRWSSETFNGTYISVNAWGYGGFAGGTENLKNSFVQVYMNGIGQLVMRWWVGGFFKNFNGKPEHGWWTSHKGGNDVKAYPRLGVGSASGQPLVTSGTPNDVACEWTNGYKHVDQDSIFDKVGLPTQLALLPKIIIEIKYKMIGGIIGADPKTPFVFGNYVLGVDSYFHKPIKGRVANDSLIGKADGINDSSGEIYGQRMSDLPETTKDWAMMVWLCKNPYYETSGGKEIGRVSLDGEEFIIKYKVETASNKKFKYVSFTRNSPAHENVEGHFKLDYNRFVTVVLSDEFQLMLEESNCIFKGEIAKKPERTDILSDINYGIETLSNPDTAEENQVENDVACAFDVLSFKIGEKEFGFRR